MSSTVSLTAVPCTALAPLHVLSTFLHHYLVHHLPALPLMLAALPCPTVLGCCRKSRLNPSASVTPQLSKYPALNNLEAKTQVPKAYAVLGVTALFASFIFFNIFAGFLSTLLGWALPAYFSLKALETPSQGDDTQWLTYWTVFGAFQIVEYFSDMILYW